jgi:hypothetical protein
MVLKFRSELQQLLVFELRELPGLPWFFRRLVLHIQIQLIELVPQKLAPELMEVFEELQQTLRVLKSKKFAGFSLSSPREAKVRQK